MLNTSLDKAIAFVDRYEREIAIIAGAWFVISCASWIPWIPIPEVPYVTDRNSWMLSGGWNAVWWGFVHPMLEKRREELHAIGSHSDDSNSGDGPA